jgi:dihydroorotase-like cyclic amidohydrolase
VGVGGPARLAGFPGKGAIAVGRDADLVTSAPDERWQVAERLHRNPITPHGGREPAGVVRRTWLRGVEADEPPAAGCSAAGGRTPSGSLASWGTPWRGR